MVHYSFENEEHSVLPHPHGNSKSQSGYVGTMPSTRCKLCEVSHHLPPKHAVGEVRWLVWCLESVKTPEK